MTQPPPSSMPGGAYSSNQNPDGTWNVHGVPMLIDTYIPVNTPEGTKKFRVTPDWLKRAVLQSKLRYSRDKFLAPLHVNHHQTGREISDAGKYILRRLARVMYEGRPHIAALASLMFLPAEVYERLRKGRLPYLSAEIHNVGSPEIDSVALMADTVPFLRLPMLTVGTERPYGNVRQNGATQAQLACSVRGGAAVLIRPAGVRLQMPFPDPAAGGGVADPREAVMAALAGLTSALESALPQPAAPDPMGMDPMGQPGAAPMGDPMDAPAPDPMGGLPADPMAPSAEPMMDPMEGAEELPGEMPGAPAEQMPEEELLDPTALQAMAPTQAITLMAQTIAKLQATNRDLKNRQQRKAANAQLQAHVNGAVARLSTLGIPGIDGIIKTVSQAGPVALESFVTATLSAVPAAATPPTTWHGEQAVGLGVGSDPAGEQAAAYLSALPPQQQANGRKLHREALAAKSAGLLKNTSAEKHVKACLAAMASQTDGAGGAVLIHPAHMKTEG